MGFSKQGYEPEVAVEVRHNWHPGSVFVFYFPKVLPQAALDAEASFLGLNQDGDKDAVRTSLIDPLAEMATREPEGFDDFPCLTDVARAVGTVSIAPLAERFRNYFDEPDKPELEQIVSGAWAAYKQGARPQAFLKRLQADSAGGGQPSGVSREAPSVV